jgi:hypothetical protein
VMGAKLPKPGQYLRHEGFTRQRSHQDSADSARGRDHVNQEVTQRSRFKSTPHTRTNGTRYKSVLTRLSEEADFQQQRCRRTISFKHRNFRLKPHTSNFWMSLSVCFQPVLERTRPVMIAVVMTMSPKVSGTSYFCQMRPKREDRVKNHPGDCPFHSSVHFVRRGLVLLAVEIMQFNGRTDGGEITWSEHPCTDASNRRTGTA